MVVGEVLVKHAPHCASSTCQITIHWLSNFENLKVFTHPNKPERATAVLLPFPHDGTSGCVARFCINPEIKGFALHLSAHMQRLHQLPSFVELVTLNTTTVLTSQAFRVSCTNWASAAGTSPSVILSLNSGYSSSWKPITVASVANHLRRERPW